MTSLKAIASELHKPGPILLTTHIMPDGDSIGSLLALGLSLSNGRDDVILYSEDSVPDRYSFLGGSDKIVSQTLPDIKYERVVILDCSDHLRVRPIWEKIKDAFIINIDHHPTNQLFGRINYVDPSASATGEIVFSLLQEMGISLDIELASAIYVAIATDTGSFKFENTTAKTHRVIAQLLEKGISLREITPRIFDLRARSAVNILTKALASLQYSRNGKVAWMSLTEKEMNESGAKDEHLEGIVNYAHNIEGVDVGLLFREKEDGTVKIGFRSKNIDVAKLAQTLGGGGHPRAAGCSIEGTSLGQAVENVLGIIDKYL